MRPPPLVRARFVARPTRFLVIADLGGGREVEAHLADPGRLRELLVPGAELRLRAAPPGGTRRTRQTAVLVRAPAPARAWVSLDTTLPNRLARDLLQRGLVRGIGPGGELRAEVARGGSRFDFVVSRPDGETLVEVKSVTLVQDGVARFPDAPTARGARHVREIEAFVRRGGRGVVLFVVQRHDARAVTPNRATDPAFARALASARRAGVLLRAASFRLRADGTARHLGALPVRLA